MNTKSQNPLISLFGIPTKAIFLLSTTLTLLLYSACKKDDPPPAEPLMVTYDATTKAITGLNPDLPAGDVNLVIPANIDGVAIDSIRHGAFYNNTRIVSLRIAEGIKHIGDTAFLAINRSTETLNSRIAGELIIPNSVETIGIAAFGGCKGFTGSLAIPNSVVNIGAGAFSGCFGFTGNLTIGESVKTIGESAFQDCFGFIGSLTIGESVKTIGGDAFWDCSGFTGSLTIPNFVETIGGRAFQRCSGFTGGLTIGNSVKTIGDFAFNGCSGFTGSLTIPNSVETIGTWAFEGMARIDSFIFENSEPPFVGLFSKIFRGIPTEDLNIIVPADAVGAYRVARGFSQYSARIRAAE